MQNDDKGEEKNWENVNQTEMNNMERERKRWMIKEETVNEEQKMGEKQRKQMR